MTAVRPAIRLPTGVRDFLPLAAARRRAIAERLLGVFEAFGYARIITPQFECADVLERGLGEDARRAAIRFVEPGTGEVVALRPDITPQIARIAATRMRDTGGPLRLCYEGAVVRLTNGPRGQREILQAGVELIDAESPEGDAEAIAVAAAALAASGIHEVALDIGHVAPARWALAAIDDPAVRAAVREAMSKKDRGGVVRAARGTDPRLAELLAALPTLYGSAAETLARARALPWPDEVVPALDMIETVLALTEDVVERELHAAITVDLGEVRGFEYYTGIRFAGYAAGVGDAILRGGRYDELVERYGRIAHATGFAVDIEAIAHAQHAEGIAAPAPAPAVLVVAPRRRDDGRRLAAALRAAGTRAAVDLGRDRDRDQLDAYASGVGFSCVLVVDDGGATARSPGGDDEVGVAGDAITAALAGDGAALLAAIQP